MERNVVLRQARDDRESSYFYAQMAASGDVRIEGQDLGKLIEVFFGQGLTGYEYVLTIKAADVPALIEALGAKSDGLSAIQ